MKYFVLCLMNLSNDDYKIQCSAKVKEQTRSRVEVWNLTQRKYENRQKHGPCNKLLHFTKIIHAVLLKKSKTGLSKCKGIIQYYIV